jgi:NAD(P)-dependent dehydrogenase (short-subunit alcohol dehydrogenase family)
MGRFTNKMSGIGLAAARSFIKEGATVVVIGRCPPATLDIPARRIS